MKLIVCLGNPGKQYELTRHNAGFLAGDAWLKNHPAITCSSKFQAEICEVHIGMPPVKVFLVKPQTFMNNSGQAVSEIANFYKLDFKKDLLVIHDEKDLPLGTIRSTESSSSAGHNGIKSIIEQLGSQDFKRVRIGVESRSVDNQIATSDFVLQRFTNEELEKLQKDIFPEVSKIIDQFITQ
jgi:PTH1 family peptidyl-tRNA hydrolase